VSEFASLSKGLVQIQTGCNHSCAYCIVSKLRGKNVSFPYEQILRDARALVDNGYAEIVLTGVDIAGYRQSAVFGLSDLCKSLLSDLPNLRRLRLSSLDPGIDLRPIVDIMRRDDRMLPHMHLSMQSGANAILATMGRRHNAEMVRKLMLTCHSGNSAQQNCPESGCTSPGMTPPVITFSWDMIFGFPGETDEMFAETCALIRELKPIHLHAFPFSPRPGTAAASMPNQVERAESKRRVKIATGLARENKRAFMETQLGQTVQLLVEGNNIGHDAHDIPVIIAGKKIPNKSIVDVKLTGIAERKELMFVGMV
jgi:threonylcarbamoyladenosine tRNA methylthiotransferase MtaB